MIKKDLIKKSLKGKELFHYQSFINRLSRYNIKDKNCKVVIDLQTTERQLPLASLHKILSQRITFHLQKKENSIPRQNYNPSITKRTVSISDFQKKKPTQFDDTLVITKRKQFFLKDSLNAQKKNIRLKTDKSTGYGSKLPSSFRVELPQINNDRRSFGVNTDLSAWDYD